MNIYIYKIPQRELVHNPNKPEADTKKTSPQEAPLLMKWKWEQLTMTCRVERIRPHRRWNTSVVRQKFNCMIKFTAKLLEDDNLKMWWTLQESRNVLPYTSPRSFSTSWRGPDRSRFTVCHHKSSFTCPFMQNTGPMSKQATKIATMQDF